MNVWSDKTCPIGQKLIFFWRVIEDKNDDGETLKGELSQTTNEMAPKQLPPTSKIRYRCL